MLQLLHISNFHLSPIFTNFLFPYANFYILCNTTCIHILIYKSHLSMQLNSHVSSLSFGKYRIGIWKNIEFHSKSAFLPPKCLCNFAVQTMSGACWIGICYIAVDFWVRFISLTHSIFNFTRFFPLSLQWFEFFLNVGMATKLRWKTACRNLYVTAQLIHGLSHSQ